MKNFRASILGKKEDKLVEAAANGDLEKLQGIVKKKNTSVNKEDPEGRTALYMASKNGRKDCVEFLLSLDADANLADKSQRNALHVAVLGDHLECVKLLLKSSIKIDAKDENESTALHISLASASTDVAKHLLGAGASIEAVDKNGRTPLLLALAQNFAHSAKLLIEKGASENAKDKDGITALMYACELGSEEIVQLLLKKGADAKAKDEGGQTATDYATKAGKTACVDLLQKAAPSAWGGGLAPPEKEKKTKKPDDASPVAAFEVEASPRVDRKEVEKEKPKDDGKGKAPAAATPSSGNEVQDLKATIETMRKKHKQEIKELEDDNEELDAELSKMRIVLADMEAKVIAASASSSSSGSVSADVTALRKQLADAQAERDDAKKTLQNTEALLEKGGQARQELKKKAADLEEAERKARERADAADKARAALEAEIETLKIQLASYEDRDVEHDDDDDEDVDFGDDVDLPGMGGESSKAKGDRETDAGHAQLNKKIKAMEKKYAETLDLYRSILLRACQGQLRDGLVQKIVEAGSRSQRS
eukprot:Opistho-2@54257